MGHCSTAPCTARPAGLGATSSRLSANPREWHWTAKATLRVALARQSRPGLDAAQPQRALSTPQSSASRSAASLDSFVVPLPVRNAENSMPEEGLEPPTRGL